MNDLSSDDFDKLLDDFITSQLNDAEDILADEHYKKTKKSSSETPETIDKTNYIQEKKEEKNYSYYEYMDNQSSKEKYLAIEERRLYDALINLIKSSIDCAKEAGIEVKKFTFSSL